MVSDGGTACKMKKKFWWNKESSKKMKSGRCSTGTWVVGAHREIF